MTTTSIDWIRLWRELEGRFVLEAGSIHGPAHWARVERHAVALALRHGGDVTVARLFAVFHDVCRQSDGADRDHGARGAELAGRLRGTLFDVTEAQFALLHHACCRHTAGDVSPDLTIGACWDADRLDLWRAAITPAPAYMSTPHARTLAELGHIGLAYTPELPAGL